MKYLANALECLIVLALVAYITRGCQSGQW